MHKTMNIRILNRVNALLTGKTGKNEIYHPNRGNTHINGVFAVVILIKVLYNTKVKLEILGGSTDYE